VAAAQVHRPTQAGISGGESESADSIVVSGGYEDYGSVILYTGQGGRDETGKQVADQTLTRGNLALAVSCNQGLPVRVVRGAGRDPQHAPSSGYRYDGLESYGQTSGRSGHKIWRYRLESEPASKPLTNPPPRPPPGPEARAYFTVQPLVRNTAVTQWVKDLYGCRCQVCGETVMTAAGPYAEGAHLRPVGSPHHGPDAVENVLCLCPNDHVRVDRGAIGFDPGWRVIELSTGTVVGTLNIDSRHPLDAAQARYHAELLR
jgi:putative restriction endonuclease